ncbi:hypothetical protein QFZ20_002128 [Flavobacterium sp. W4I14]|nr:hypothetical protein [Flavobacterium sp. W4I14]
MGSKIKIGIFFFLYLLFANTLYAQNVGGVQSDGSKLNNIVTAVPFLLIVPQARTGAMGNAGVAILSADANAPSLNTAALAYLPKGSSGISISYSPWLKNLSADINLSYLSGYYRLDERNTLAASLRYFSLGNVAFLDNSMQDLGVFTPNEMAFDIDYARSFGPSFALGGSLRYIYSNLYNGQFTSGVQARAGKAVAVDISGIYKKDVILLGTDAVWSTGLSLSNIGTKMNYSMGGQPYYLPANLKIGTAATLLPGQNSHFIIALDLNKLMVPTQPVYDNDGKIVEGKDPNRSVPSGTFGSFSDAPGGLAEELKETSLSIGLEYSYQQKFALRMGYNYQHPEKGNSSYFTLGAGFAYSKLILDLSYLAGNARQSPLANTLRFGLQLRFGDPSQN